MLSLPQFIYLAKSILCSPKYLCFLWKINLKEELSGKSQFTSNIFLFSDINKYIKESLSEIRGFPTFQSPPKIKTSWNNFTC